MALLERAREPTRRELQMFGAILTLVFGVIGGIVLWQSGSWRFSIVSWAIGMGLATLYYAAPALRLPMYYVWMSALYPVGWVISHLLLVIVFFGVVTPIGILARWTGLLSFNPKIDRSAKSYLKPISKDEDLASYFRQY